MNGVRGEVRHTLAGEPRRLCLTLGGLAEIETALGVEGLTALADRMRNLSSSDLLIVLAALLRGGGQEEAADRVNVLGINPREAAEAVAKAFAAAAE